MTCSEQQTGVVRCAIAKEVFLSNLYVGKIDGSEQWNSEKRCHHLLIQKL